MSEPQSVDTSGALAHLIRAARLQQGFTRDELVELILANGVVDNLSLSPLLLILFRETLIGAGKPGADVEE